MAWYWWVLVWVVLILVAAGVLTSIGLSLWRRVKLLGREVREASDRLETISGHLQELAERSPDPAIFTSPSALRQERILEARRREGRHPAGSAQPAPVQSGRRRRQRVR